MESFFDFMEGTRNRAKKNVFADIQDQNEYDRNRDFLAEAKEAYKSGVYDKAWILANRAMLMGGNYGGGIGMLIKMVKKGKFKIELENVKEEPEIVFEDGKFKTKVRVKTMTGICETTAAIVCGIARRFRSKIELCRKGHSIHVNATDILMLEALALMKGTEVEIQAEGEDAEEAVRTLGKVFLGILVDG